MKLIAIILPALMGILFCSTVFAVGYREGEPPTLAAPPSPVQDNSYVVNDFARHYRAKGSPVIALFWNREQTDQLQRHHEVVTRSTERTSSTGTEDTVNDSKGTHTLRDSDGLKENVTKESDTNFDDNKRAGLNEKADTILRSVFRDELASAGVKFVDRNMMMRTSAAMTGVTDAQLSETDGLLSKAAWLMEVVLVPDQDAPLGYGFRIIVKNIKKSTIITEFYTQAQSTFQGKQPLIAVPGQGFVRAQARPSGINDIGYNLAIEVMTQLKRNL